MPDIATVVTSVGCTLAIQSTYLFVTKFPAQIHRSKASLQKLRTREDSEHSLVKNITGEIKAGSHHFDHWFEHLEACGNREEGQLIDRAYFRDVIPSLSTRLGRLQGLSTSMSKSYPIDPLPDFIWLYEQARRISKDLASYEKSKEIDFDFEFSEFALFKARVTARFEQLPHELEIMQIDTQAEISQLEAELIDLKTQFIGVGLFLLICMFLLSRSAASGLLSYSTLHGRASSWSLLIAVIATLFAGLPGLKFFKARGNIETQSRESHG